MAACGDDQHTSSADAGADIADGAATETGVGDGGAQPANPDLYEFPGRNGADSSVAYSGQVMRNLLLAALKANIGDLTDDIDAARFTPTDDGEVVARLDVFFRFDSDIDGDAPIDVSFALPLVQQVWLDVSSGKDLVGKLAGNDAVTDHRSFAGDDSEFAGWSDASITASGGSLTSPEGLVTAFFETLEDNAIAYANAEERTAFDGTSLPVHVTESGLDLQQLTQKLLTVGISLSQGLDDYLDDDTDGKGLLSPHTAEDGDPYTTLEHQWDEGFGYFGAARDYLTRTDDEIADGAYDSNGDGSIDLLTEWTTQLSVNAAKRDNGATDATDFTGDAMQAFLDGRALLASTEGQLSEEQLSELRGHRDQIALAWESALAATVIHYINDTLAAYDAYDADPETYDFLEHAKAWSELKGFALGFQFHRNSPMLDDFAQFHTLIGDAPVLPNAEGVDAYIADLLTARDLVASAFGFTDANARDW